MVTVRLATPPKFVMFALVAYSVFSVVLPDTVKLVSVPKVVILGWFDVVSVALIVFALMLFATFKFCSPLIAVKLARAELNTSAVIVPATVILFA